MESTLQKPALVAAKTTPKAKTIVYWMVTALFCMQMSFTAYYMLLRLPEAALVITRLGFPAYFRVELSWAKLLGVVLLLAPAPGAGLSPSISPRRSSPTSQWAIAGGVDPVGGQRPPACSGCSRTSSGTATPAMVPFYSPDKTSRTRCELRMNFCREKRKESNPLFPASGTSNAPHDLESVCRT